jgi:hypothetical protein
MAFEPERFTTYSDGVLASATSFIGTAQQASLSLLGFFAILDIILFGIAIAMGQRDMLAKAIWKLLLLGLVLLLVRDGSLLIRLLSDSALYLAKGKAELIPDPVGFAAVGIGSALDLMRLSADTGPQLMGASMSLSILAIALVIAFALASGTLLYQLAAFHIVAGMSLVMLPIGLFTPGRALLARAGRGLLTATVRLTVVILISLPLPTLLDAMMSPITRQSSLDVPLTQLCLGLSYFVLLLGLPRAAIAVVGDFAGTPSTQPEARPQPAAATTIIPPLARASVQAATALPVGANTRENWASSAASSGSGGNLERYTASLGSLAPAASGGLARSGSSFQKTTASGPGTVIGGGARQLQRGELQGPQVTASSGNLERLVSDALRKSLALQAPTRGYQAIAAGARTEDDDEMETPDAPRP